MVLFHWRTRTEPYFDETSYSGFLAHVSFPLQKGTTIKAFLGLESYSYIKLKRCLFTVQTIYIMIYYMLIPANKFERITVLCWHITYEGLQYTSENLHHKSILSNCSIII